MRLLITGGTGMLGKSLQKAFAPHSNITTYYSGSKHDLTNKDKSCSLFDEFRPDVVINAAAKCGGIKFNQENPAVLFRDNMEIGINTYEMARIFGVKKVYSLGTVCSYPYLTPTPFQETSLWTGYPEPTNAPYGIAKLGHLVLSQSYRQQFGVGGAFFLPVNLFGMNDTIDIDRAHVIPALIMKFLNAVSTGSKSIFAYGDGSAYREFLPVDSLAEALVKAVVDGFDCDQPINLGTGKTIQIKNLISLIAKKTGFTGDVVFTGDVSNGQPYRQLDTSRAKELLDWECNSDFEIELEKTIEWYRGRLSNLNKP